MEKINYLNGDRFCPTHEPQVVYASHFARISDKKADFVEGVCFDRDRNLYVIRIKDGEICRFDEETKKFITVYRNEELQPVSVKFHKDGRMFICSDAKKAGVFAYNMETEELTTILSGYVPNDLVFTSDGSFYFTNFLGDLAHATGGVYYVSPDYKKVEPIMEGMIRPNGIALSTNEEVLWITEMCTNRLYRMELYKPSRSCIAYNFNGFQGADSCSVDEDDNVYVAMVGQGRVMVFNPYGWHIANIDLPGRAEGHNLRSTHPMVHPDKAEVYICTADDLFQDGAWMFKAPSFARGNRKSYQFI